MGNRNKINFLFYLVFIASFIAFSEGCTYVERFWREATILRYRITNSPGEKFLSSYSKVLEEHNCHNRKSLYIESFSFGPPEVGRDEQLFNRFIYASCYQDVVPGSITRRVIFNTETLIEKVENYEFKPGRRAVSAYLHISPQAEQGLYNFEIELNFSELAEAHKSQFEFMILAP